MTEIFQIKANIGTASAEGGIVFNATCPYCVSMVGFRQVAYNAKSMVAVSCESCGIISTYILGKQHLEIRPKIKGISRVPDKINKYYQEGLRCLHADSPNGAVTLFRKTIHAIGIHYGLAKPNDDQSLYNIIKKLQDNGHIVQKISDALRGIKDIGNDGAHINDNEPDMEQAEALQHLIEVVLNSTVVTDEELSFVQGKHKAKQTMQRDGERQVVTRVEE